MEKCLYPPPTPCEINNTPTNCSVQDQGLELERYWVLIASIDLTRE